MELPVHGIGALVVIEAWSRHVQGVAAFNSSIQLYYIIHVHAFTQMNLE
jgi:hypothetical protein